MAEAAVEVPKEVSTTEEKQPPVKNLSEDAFHNFLQGKRHMLVKDYSHAVQSLADACELYVEYYGPLAVECGEVYFLYGKALFNYFQQQAGIFGDSMPDGEEEEEEEEENGGSEDDKDEEEEKPDEENEDSSNDTKEDDSESISSSKDGEKCEVGKGDSGTENNTNDNEPTSTSGSNEMDASVPNVQPESSEANEASEANKIGHEANNDAAEAGPSQSKEKTEDEISDLQLAWENLETAKSIFQKKGDQKENELKVAEILLLLGEISLECDNYEAAIRDLKEGLVIWQKHLSPDDRRIAETFYQLGLAHQLNNQSDRAVDYFHHTIDVIQLRIGILKNQTEIKQNEDGFDIDPNIEIADLEALLPDIKSKIEDTKDIDKDAKKAMQEFVAKKMENEGNVTSTSDEKPASNISHLLKRKKPEEPDNTKTEEVKKIKLSSPATNVEEQRPSSSETTSPSGA